MPKIDRPQPSLADVIEALETATDMTADLPPVSVPVVSLVSLWSGE